MTFLNTNASRLALLAEQIQQTKVLTLAGREALQESSLEAIISYIAGVQASNAHLTIYRTPELSIPGGLTESPYFWRGVFEGSQSRIRGKSSKVITIRFDKYLITVLSAVLQAEVTPVVRGAAAEKLFNFLYSAESFSIGSATFNEEL